MTASRADIDKFEQLWKEMSNDFPGGIRKDKKGRCDGIRNQLVRKSSSS